MHFCSLSQCKQQNSLGSIYCSLTCTEVRNYCRAQNCNVLFYCFPLSFSCVNWNKVARRKCDLQIQMKGWSKRLWIKSGEKTTKWVTRGLSWSNTGGRNLHTMMWVLCLHTSACGGVGDPAGEADVLFRRGPVLWLWDSVGQHWRSKAKQCYSFLYGQRWLHALPVLSNLHRQGSATFPWFTWRGRRKRRVMALTAPPSQAHVR